MNPDFRKLKKNKIFNFINRSISIFNISYSNNRELINVYQDYII